jgi:RNA polymerase sigma-70 factor (ECF subfamily)
MSASNEDHQHASPEGGWFTTTHWSVVLAAGHRASQQSRRALATLCETYWFPLYAYVRRTGYASHDAEELTQGFFTQLIEKEYLKDVDRQRGKFRSFLLAAMKHYLSKERERARAQKRGGGRVPISLDFRDAEHRYKLEPADELTPERVYERRWALTLLDHVLERLQHDFAETGKLNVFERLKEYLTGKQGLPPYHKVAEELAMTEGAVKVAVHRLRRRYRELLKEEIAQTVAEPDEVDEELRELFAAVRFGKKA